MSIAETLVDLEAAQTALEERIETKRGEIDACKRSLSELVSRLLESQSVDARRQLVQRRGEIVVLMGALDDEVGELIRRRDATEVARYQVRCDEAHRELGELAQISRNARRAMQDYAMVKLRMMNRGGRVPDTEKAQFERIEVDTKFAVLTAESDIAAAQNRKSQRTMGTGAARAGPGTGAARYVIESPPSLNPWRAIRLRGRTFCVAESDRPERQLLAAVLLQAIADAQEDSAEAAAWLDSVAGDVAETLGLRLQDWRSAGPVTAVNGPNRGSARPNANGAAIGGASWRKGRRFRPKSQPGCCRRSLGQRCTLSRSLSP